MDRQNAAFAELQGTCDRLSRELRQAGIGAAVKHAAVISATEEEQLWSSGAIGIYSPKALVRCVFYYVGKAFCIRGGQEQRDLKPSQFLREYNPDRYTYEENGSKNHTGHFSSSGNHNKDYLYAQTDNPPPKCLVYLLDFYFSKFPKPPNTLDFFYLKPLQQAPKNAEAAWFQATPIGRNTLAKFVQMMCDEAGIEEKKSNHSLRASGATAMFAANVPEKMIKEVTGHKSSKALEL